MGSAKTLFTVFAIIVATPLLFVIIAGCTLLFLSLRSSGAGLYETNWGVIVPGGLTELYSADGTGGIQGDGCRYLALEYAGGEDLDATLTSGANPALISGFEDVAGELGVPVEYRPDFGADCMCRTVTDPDDARSKLYIVWDGRTLYLAEWIM